MFSTRKAVSGIGLAAAIGVAAAGIIDASGGGGASASASSGTATVRMEAVSVSGHSQPILEDQNRMPLYFYDGDTTSVSKVTGNLASLWPPVTAASVTGAGLTGTLTQVKDGHGSQVAYNGHLLYTFVSDRPGVVTGQGIQHFFVATPDLTVQTPAATPTTSKPRGGYGY